MIFSFRRYFFKFDIKMVTQTFSFSVRMHFADVVSANFGMEYGLDRLRNYRHYWLLGTG